MDAKRVGELVEDVDADADADVGTDAEGIEDGVMLLLYQSFFMGLMVRSLDRKPPVKITYRMTNLLSVLTKESCFWWVLSFCWGNRLWIFPWEARGLPPPQSFLLRQNYCSLRPLVTAIPSIPLDKPARPFVVDVPVSFSVFDYLNQGDFSIASF